MPLNPADFCAMPFHEGHDVENFDCGEQELNEFLTTHEVSEYQRESAGRTHLVYKRDPWELVAYFTTAADRLEIPADWLKKSMSISLGTRQYPAVLLGRLAVCLAHQGTGIGSLILKHIFTQALEATHAVRVIRLTAYPESLQWYRKRGFAFTSEKEETKSNAHSDYRPRLFFDLNEIRHIAPRLLIPKCEGGD